MTMLIDGVNMVEGFPAVDLSTAANNGDWVSLSNYGKCAVVFVSGIGTAGQDPTLTIEQATDNSGTSSKALNIPTDRIWKKQAATNLSSVGAWADASGGVTDNTWTHADAAEESVIVWVEFKVTDLDVNNDFAYLRGTVADVGANAQPGYLFYLLYEPVYPNKPTEQVSALS